MMKKILLGTSAIVGASVLLASPVWAAEKPKLTMDGWLRWEMWGTSQDKAATPTGVNNSGFYFNMDDIRIHFRGSAKADNGLEYGFYARLQEGSGSDTSGFDDSEVYLSGNWGRLDMGTVDPVQRSYKVGAYSIVADKDGFYDGEVPFATLNNTAPGVSSNFWNDRNGNQISYYTPTFSGFTAGVSFTPNTGSSLNQGSPAESTPSATLDKNKNRSNMIGAGIQYENTFNDVGVLVQARYSTAKMTGNNLGGSTSELENPKAYGIGAKISYMGFDVAGSYNNMGNQNYYMSITKAAHEAGADGGYRWDIGGAYTTGPYKVSVAYESAQAGVANGTQDDKIRGLALGAKYAAAPGLDLYAEYEYFDLDRQGTSSDNTANLFLLGTQVSF